MFDRDVVMLITRPPLFIPPDADTRRSRMVPVKLVSTSKGRERIKRVDTYADIRMRLAASTTSGSVNATDALSDGWAIGDLVGYDGRVWSIGEVCRKDDLHGDPDDENAAPCGEILTLRPERSVGYDGPLGPSLSLDCPHTRAMAAMYAERAAKAVARADRDIAAEADRDARADARAARKAEREAAATLARAERAAKAEAKATRDAMERDIRSWAESHAGRKVGKITPVIRAAYKDYVAEIGQLAEYIDGKAKVND